MDEGQGSIVAAPAELPRSERAGEPDRPSTFALLRRIRLALSERAAGRTLDAADVDLLRDAASLLRRIAASGEAGVGHLAALGRADRPPAPRPEPGPRTARRRRRD